MGEILSAKLREHLRVGKYTRWAQHVGAEGLTQLLEAAHTVGECYRAVYEATGAYPAPNFAPHDMAEDRMRDALETVAAIASGVEVREPQYGEPMFPEGAPGLSPEYSTELGRGPASVRWAKELTERQVWTLLWAVGEYGVRVNSSMAPDGGRYPSPRFVMNPAAEARLREAIGVLARVERSW